MLTEKTDILIIGAGAAGAATAWNLSKTNFKITCLDQGPLLKKEDYSFNNKYREINKIYNFNPDTASRNLEQDYPINSDNSPISISNFNAVGGSTLVYSGHYLRFHKNDFHIKKKDGVGSNWLIDYSSLKKYYDLNDKMMGISGLTGDPAYPDVKNLLPPLDIGPSGQVLSKAFNKLNWHWWPSYAAVKKSKKFSKGIRPTVVETYLKKAIKNGLILKPNSRVLKILSSKKRITKGVIYKDKNNQKVFLKSKLIILAASAIGTPRILLNSTNKYFPKGLANDSGKVGKNLMLHPLGFIEGKFDQFLASNDGAEGCSINSITKKMRKIILDASYECGEPTHIGGALSIVETIAVIYSYFNIGTKSPLDRFILSKGHGFLALLAILYCKKFLKRREILNFQKNGSELIAHPIMNKKLE